MNIFRSLYIYRDFILGSVKREFQVKYRNSLLGATWTVINPLAMIVVYTLIFSQLMRTRLPGVAGGYAYSIYLCSGVLTWGLFSEVVNRALNMFIDNANMLKKISFPRATLPAIVVISSLINFSIIFGLFLIFLVMSGYWPGFEVFAAIPVLIVQLLFSIGLGLTLGILNVFFRDVGQFFGVFLQFWFWFTPIVYTLSILPTKIMPIIQLNPMNSIIQAYQEIFVNGLIPHWGGLIYPLVLGLLFCVVGLRLFREHVGDIVDEL